MEVILEGAEAFDDQVARGDVDTYAHLLLDFIEFHNVQHLETDAVDE